MKKIRKFIPLAILIVVIYITMNGISIYRYGFKDESCKADVAIVLGAATYNGNVSPVYKERINHAIDLYNSKYVDKIIMTGGIAKGNAKGNAVSDAYAAKEYAVNNGVLSEDILIEERSTITQENLSNTKVIMNENNMKTAIIVSDPLHMKRSMLLAKDIGIEAYSSPTPTTKYISTKTKIPFLGRELFYYIGYKVYRLF